MDEATREIPAGPLAAWLRARNSDVPCGACTGCCRSAMFVHVRPSDAGALRRIPKALLFPAPGLPRGHKVMGFDASGRCPMLVDDRCSIYEDRPATCREYDCRVFAATGTLPEDQPAIAERVSAWRFALGEEDHRELAAARASAAFLRSGPFPPGTLPRGAAQRAALALAVRDLFHARDPDDARLVAAILERIAGMRSQGA